MVQRPPVAAHLRLLPGVDTAAAVAAADLPLEAVDEPLEEAFETALATELALPAPAAELFSFFFFPDPFLTKPPFATTAPTPVAAAPPVDEAGEDAPESKRVVDEGLEPIEPREAEPPPNPESRV